MPSLTISIISWTKKRLAVGSVCRRCLLYSSHIRFLLIGLKTRFESCSTLIRASSFIAPKVYNALFIGIGVVSCMASFIFVVISSRAFCLACSFCKRISSSVSIVSSGRKKNCSSSATSVDCKFTCFGRIVMSSLICSSTISLGLRSILDRKSADYFAFPLRAWCENWIAPRNHMRSIVWWNRFCLEKLRYRYIVGHHKSW